MPTTILTSSVISKNAMPTSNNIANSGDSGISFSQILASELNAQEPDKNASVSGGTDMPSSTLSSDSTTATSLTSATDKELNSTKSTPAEDQQQVIDSQSQIEQLVFSMSSTAAMNIPTNVDHAFLTPNTIPPSISTSMNLTEVMSKPESTITQTQITLDSFTFENTQNTGFSLVTQTKTLGNPSLFTGAEAMKAETSEIAFAADASKTISLTTNPSILDRRIISGTPNLLGDAKFARIKEPATLNSAATPLETGALIAEILSPGELKAAISELPPVATPLKPINLPTNPSILDNVIINGGLPTSMSEVTNQALSQTQLSTLPPIISMSPPNIAIEASNTANVAQVIAPRVGAPDWNQALGQKMSWMVVGGHQSASLTLNPPDLGPLQVVIHVHNQHADATFISHQAEVRAAVEGAIPKLREMMEHSGIQLGECNINSQSKQQQEFTRDQANSNNIATSLNNIDTNSNLTGSHQSTIVRNSIGLVDTFV